MFFKILIVVLFGVTLAAPPTELNEFQDEDGRIIRGTPAQAQSYPFIVSLQYFPSKTTAVKFCAGSIVHKQYILTAAHCFLKKKPTPIHINAGTINAFSYGKSQTIKVIKIIRHEDYDSKRDINDICLLKLEHPLTFNKDVQPINLANPSHNAEKIGKGIILGWGATHPSNFKISSNALLYTDVNVVPITECSRHFPGLWTKQVCVENREKHSGACAGDSGGPFVQIVDNRPYLMGITSFGAQTCAIHPTVYTRVNQYVDWVSEIIKKN